MKIDDVRRTAYSMPLTSPSFPPGPYRFFNREYFVIAYRTDPEALAAVVPEPLEVTEPIVKYEFIRMPDSTGFGDYTETGQVIPVRLNGEEGVDTEMPRFSTRSIAGLQAGDFRRSRRRRRSSRERPAGRNAAYGSVLCALGTMGTRASSRRSRHRGEEMKAPIYLKIIPHVDGAPAVRELVRFHLEDITLKSLDRPGGARPVPARAR